MAIEEEETKRHVIRVHADSGRHFAPSRVLMISMTGAMGGAERSFLELAATLRGEKCQPLICVPPDTPLERLCTIAQHPVFAVNLRRFRRTTNPFILAGQVRALYQGSRSIAQICTRERVDILHGNTDNAALVAWEVSRLTRLPFVWHCRDMVRMHGVAKILGNSAAAVVAISAAVENHLLNEGVPSSKVHRIDNGIDLSRIRLPADRAAVRARVRASLGIEADRPVLLCVGGFTPWKKHEHFLDLLAEFRSRVPPLLGLLVGSAQVSQNEVYDKMLREHARQLKLGDDLMRFLGERDDVPDLMVASDLLVSCSEDEPFGRVLVEAGASGLPAVSTRSGAKAEIIEDRKTGLLVEPGNIEALAATCTKLLADPALRQQMGAAASERVERCYNIKRTATQLTEVFESIAERKQA